MAKQKWVIDAAHSEILFKVKHLVISNVTGKFKKFDATLEHEAADFSDAQISFSADVDSIDTGIDQRDAHLKSDDFFNAEKFPKLTFVSTSFKKISADKYELIGGLTIRDITKTLVFDVEYGGQTKDPWNQIKLGFEISGKINRKDFNLAWSAVTEAGGLVVGDEVKLIADIELTLVA